MEKTTIMLGLFVGSIVGSWLPVAVSHQGWFSAASLIGGFVGAVAGTWLGWKLTQWIEY
ncbi:MAG TPA: hypothetical protein VMH50_17100 [Thermoleophilia bacterium]|nr:hypothetical protein [Thermoleophilia bacterium]